MEPFRITYTLSRRHRVAEIFPWLPAVAGGIGFSTGVAYLAFMISPWFLALLAVPVVLFRGLYILLWQLAFDPGKPVEVVVDGDTLTVVSGTERRERPLDGIIQVFRDGDDWVVLHADRSVVHIPVGTATDEQLAYLKDIALRAARERR